MQRRENDRRARLSARESNGTVVLHVVLVVFLWVVLHTLDAKITDTVVVTTVAGVFGPGVLRVGRDWLQGKPADPSDRP